MKKYLIILTILLFQVLIYGQRPNPDSLTFLVEFEYKLTNKILDKFKLNRELKKVFAKKLIEKYWCEFNISNLGIEVEGKLRQKEGYYKLASERGLVAYINIPNDIPKSGVDIKWVFYYMVDSIKSDSPLLTNDNKQIISLKKPLVESIYYINENTFISEETIKLGSPEEITVDIITDYIEEKLFNESDSLGGFVETIKKLETINLEKNIINNSDVKGYFRLLNFLEPYVHANSFLNNEAKSLKEKIDTFKKSNSSNLNSRDSLSIAYASKIYFDYQKSIEIINYYYRKLRLVLFSETSFPLSPPDTLGIGEDSSKKQPSLNFAFNSFVGVNIAREDIDQLDDNVGINSIGLTTPIGISFSREFQKQGSVGVFMSFIDIGSAATTFRWDNSTGMGTINEFPELTFRNLWSPGLFVVYQFNNRSPFWFGVGLQESPLRKVEISGIEESLGGVRASIFFAYHIPIFKFKFSRNKEN
ncbi:MAG: hypothetical protein AB8H03_19575 [Saprospiraceae bacterium]